MLIINRFEGIWAVVETEDRQTFNLPRHILPQDIREGDVITISVNVDQIGTDERRNKVQKLLENFFDE